MLQNIPLELRERAQWVTWRYETKPGASKPTKPLYDPRTGWHAKSTDPATWVTFDVACAAVEAGVYTGVGYVIADGDPYTFIDLDTYDETLTAEDKDRHQKIAAAFQGYAEISPSGNGLHLIVKGSVLEGRRRKGIEVYSSGRYMTMTGNVWRNAGIVEQQDLLNILWGELEAPSAATKIYYSDEPQTQEDKEVCTTAAYAANGEKFQALYLGKFEDYYSSQSQADFALIDIIAYYTHNRDQIKRIFRASALGKRDKANRGKYVDEMVSKAFDNQPPPIDLDALKLKLEAKIAAPQAVEALPEVIPSDEVFTPPPGLIGEIASYIYAAAPRPVPEVALCASIGLMAGIAGRSYNISGTGLNQYILLLAPTGSGKEAMASGIAHLMNEVQKSVPASMDFIGPGAIRSDAALLKYLAKKSASFVTIGGEFGQTMQQMSSPMGSSHLKAIKQVMLDLYGKSGSGNTLRPTIYSEAEKNTLALQSPAFTFVGESAPEPFYESVSEALISDGLLPRFTLIEYQGNQPPLNQNAHCLPHEELVNRVATLCANSLNLNGGDNSIEVRILPEAKVELDAFERSCREKINALGNREVIRQIWNRAHLRALKLAGLCAVGEHPFEPCVTLAAARWSIRLSAHNTQRLLDRFERGEVGSQTHDDKHVKEVSRCVGDFLRRDWEYNKKYTAFRQLWNDKIVPFQYIQRRLTAVAAFRLDRRGGLTAMNVAIKALVDSGELIEVSKMTMHTKYSLTCRSFAIGDSSGF